MKKLLLFTFIALIQSSCGFKVDSSGSNDSEVPGTIISGLVSPFVGLISQNDQQKQLVNYLMNSANAFACSDPAYVKLYRIQNDGSIDEANPISTQTLDTDARYAFEVKDFGINAKNKNVEFIVKAEGCNGETFKRPVTSFNTEQDINAKTTVIAETINANTILANTLNEVKRKQVELIINSISGSNTTAALNSLTTNVNNAALFTQIFGSSPAAIQSARPEVQLIAPQVLLNELQVSTFSVSTFHVDPNYSFAYKWKVDGVVKTSHASLDYIPASNDQGTHQIDVYVGKDDGTGNIDLTKPYFTKTYTATVNNNILPTAPNFTISASNMGPINSSNIFIDIETGTSMSNCESFSTMAYTLTPTAPGPIAFNTTCSTNGMQIKAIDLYGADGLKTIYLWAKDSEGNISSAKTQNIIFDRTAPAVTLTPQATSFQGGASYNFLTPMSDNLSAITNVAVQISTNNGSTFTDIENYTNSISSFSYTFPAVNSSAYKFKIRVKDAANNERIIETASLTIDSIAPTALEISLSTNSISNSRDVGLNVVCSSDNDKVLISLTSSVPLKNDSSWEDCSPAKNIQVSAGDGIKAIYAFTKDLVGNISTATSLDMTLDQTGPTLYLTSFNSGALQGGSAYNITWTLSDTHPASNPVTLAYALDGINYTQIASSLANTGTYTWTAPLVDLDTLKIKISAVDSLNNLATKTSSSGISIDINAPTSNSLVVPGAITSTGNRNILLNLNASDSQTNITHFCLKHVDSTTPLLGDACWNSLTSLGIAQSKSLNIANFGYQIGILQGDYTVRAWFRDIYDHVSTNTNTLNVDAYTITYNPDPAPVLSNITAASVDSPSSPLTLSDTTVTIGNDLYIKWNITDNAAIPNGKISLYYTTNDTTYTLIANNLDNAQNSSCTINANQTGCYKWTASSPTSSYYKVKLLVSDSINQTVYDLSNPVNTGTIKFLSGNTSLGIGGSASNAIFFSYGEDGYNDLVDNQSLAVTKTGYIFFKYYNRGIVYISPNDGLVRDLILNTGSSTGDNGNVFLASLNAAKRIDLDQNENLIIWDYNRIRRVDLSTSPWTITTIAGGGADTSSGANALSASIPSIASAAPTDTMTILPNGNIYFEKGKELWYYDASDAKIKLKFSLAGFGTDNLSGDKASFNNEICPGKDISLGYDKSTSAITKIMRRYSTDLVASCTNIKKGSYSFNTNFNPTTGLAEAPHAPQTTWSSTKFTGKDGKFYVLPQGRGAIQRYNQATNTFETIVGNGTNGRCADGQLATTCPVVALSAFVNEYGKIYFVDLGVIRTVDTDGKIQTIAGQPRNFGVGFNPVSARYSQISFFEVFGNDVFVKNELENQIVKFSLGGGSLTHIAGNTIKGAPIADTDAKVVPLPNKGWGNSSGLIYDYIKNRLYHYFSGYKVSYIDLATGKWVLQSTTGIQDSSVSTVTYLAFNPPGEILTNIVSQDGIGGALSTLKVMDTTTTSATLIYGSNPNQPLSTGSICDGIIGTSCILPSNYQYDTRQLRYKFDSITDEWLLATRGSTGVSRIPKLGGITNFYETTVNTISSFDFYRDGSNNEFIFYCTNGGNLYKRNVATNIETLLPLPTTSMKCGGMSLYYHQARNSLIFSYRQNNLDGIAEYTSP